MASGGQPGAILAKKAFQVEVVVVESVGQVRRGATGLAAGERTIFQQHHFTAFFAEQAGRGQTQNATAAGHHLSRKILTQGLKSRQRRRGAKPRGFGAGRATSGVSLRRGWHRAQREAQAFLTPEEGLIFKR